MGAPRSSARATSPRSPRSSTPHSPKPEQLCKPRQGYLDSRHWLKAVRRCLDCRCNRCRHDVRGENLRTARRTIGVALTVAALAVGGAAVTAPAAPAQVAPGPGVTQCNALASAAAQVESLVASSAATAAALQQRLAAGGLNPRQAALARAQLALVRLQLAVLNALLN